MKKYIYQVDQAAQDSPAKLLRAVGRSKRVLEVGCASGVQTRILAENLECKVTGIEIDPAAAAEAAKFCERVIVGDLESNEVFASLGSERFDVITIADVLEHLRDPSAALKKLKPHLDATGYVLASIPNVVHAGLVLQMAHGRFDYRPYGLLDDTHLRFFTLKSVLRLFEESGLTITDIDRVIRSVESTEFAMHRATPDEMPLLDFMRQNNPEWQTYQFIVRAVASPVEGALQTYGQLETQDRLKDTELTNKVLAKQVTTLQNQIAWMESRLPYRMLRRLKRWFAPRATA